jgi:2'-5' RNA ligase
MTGRYAIYYAPDSDSPLWLRASQWLGRDAASGQDVPQYVPLGSDAAAFSALTADASHYGFHATLKAPFALAEDACEEELLAAVEEFATQRAAFSEEIAPQILGHFIAFRLAEKSAEMQALHEDCVCEFDNFRALPTHAELERRRKAKLNDQQDRQLVEWGYPYIFDDFRFHMTLSGRIEDAAMRQAFLDAAMVFFADDIGAHRFGSLCVFHQPDRESGFNVKARFPFLG